MVLMAGLGYLFSKMLNISSTTGSLQQVFTAANERRMVQLPDGSLVSMEPGTVLDYPKAFNGKTREVRLKGEAFFEITRDPKHPFVIHTQQISTTVLGTSFNVAAYAFREPSVVVVTGKVKVQAEDNGTQAVVLSPNQSVVYHSNTHALQKEEAPDDAVYCRQRREGKFIYRGIALEKVVEDLQRFYNTDIKIEEGVKKCLFYGDFFTVEKLDKALNLIACSLNATVKKDDYKKRYLIVGGSCQ
jgi:ferric-dicitrate binding protein FerR (iron transport regulator)